MSIEKRSTINSQTIQEKFPDLYKEFFSKCQVVVSTDDSFFLAGEIARFFGGLSIIQKLPTKVYLGLELTSEKIFDWGERYGYSPSEDQFRRLFSSYPVRAQRLYCFLSSFWQKLVRKNKGGFKIHTISESRRGNGLGSTGTTRALLSTALLILAKKIKPSSILKWKRKQTSSLISDPTFCQVFSLARKLSAIARAGQSSGATSFSALLESSSPILYLSQDTTSLQKDPSLQLPCSHLDYCSIFEKLSFWGAKMEEIFNLKIPLIWPIDLAALYVGSEVTSEIILKSIYEFKENLEKITLSLKKWIPQEKDIWEDYQSIINITSPKILYFLRKIFERPTEESLKEFFVALDEGQEILTHVGASTPLLDHIYQTLLDEAGKYPETLRGGAKLGGMGKGGHFIFVTPAGTFREEIYEVIKKLRRETKKDIYLDWASWQDDFGQDGVKVEQSLEDGIYSDFLLPDSYNLTLFIKNQPPQSFLVSQAQLEDEKKKIDLLLDETNHKIFLKGKQLHSSQIPSAKATISILRIILLSKSKEVSCEQLPESSYSQSRYDLQSKITSPLSKLVKEKTGKNLEFQISGGIYENFSVGLKPTEVLIGLVKRIR